MGIKLAPYKFVIDSTQYEHNKIVFDLDLEDDLTKHINFKPLHKNR